MSDDADSKQDAPQPSWLTKVPAYVALSPGFAVAGVLVFIGVICVGIGLDGRGLLKPWPFVPLGVLFVIGGVAVVVLIVRTIHGSPIGANRRRAAPSDTSDLSILLTEPPDLVSVVPRPIGAIWALAKVVNRDGWIHGGVVLLWISLIALPLPIVTVVAGWPFVFDGETAQGRVIGRERARAALDGEPRRPLAYAAAVEGPAQVRAAGFPTPLLAHGGGKNRVRNWVEYEFRDHLGEVRRGRSSVGKDDWERLRPGDAITVWYVASNPERNTAWTGFNSFYLVPIVAGCIGALAVVIALRFIAVGLATGLRTSWRLRRGPLVVGMATGVGSIEYGECDIEYVYLCRAAFASEARSRAARATLPGKFAANVRPGSAIPVVLDPDDPDCSFVDGYGIRSTEYRELLDRLNPSCQDTQ